MRRICSLLAFDAAPDLNRRWRLVITVGAGAITGEGDDTVINPDLVTLTWEQD